MKVRVRVHNAAVYDLVAGFCAFDAGLHPERVPSRPFPYQDVVMLRGERLDGRGCWVFPADLEAGPGERHEVVEFGPPSVSGPSST